MPLMIVLRFFHIVSGVLWAGGAVFTFMFLTPTIRATGPAGTSVMRHLLVNTKFAPYFPALGGLTVLSGIIMFWHDGSVSNGAFYSSAQGMTLSVGALFGIIALVVGGPMVGRSFGQLASILNDIDAAGGQPTQEQGARMTHLRVRIANGSRIVFPSLLIAVIAMAIARYV